MIDKDKLEALVQLMVENDLSELDISDGEESVRLKRGGLAPTASPAGWPAGAPAPAASAPAPRSDADAAHPTAGDDAGLSAIESPMVGTFYASPDPDSPPFVQAGDRVGPETVVCLVEAMKVFNEVKAETSGVIERVLMKNGDAVEFGQQLFLVRPV